MTEENISSSQESYRPAGWRFWMPRVSAGLVGLILLTAGVSKAMDMELFVRQIRDYGIISHPVLLIASAWGMVALECVLGVGLLVFYRPRLTLSVTAALVLMFVVVNTWAWLTNAAEDCGCFGEWLKHTPGEAAFQNLVMLAVTALAWPGHRYVRKVRTRAKAWVVIIASVIGLTLPVLFGMPSLTPEKLPAKVSGIGPIEVHGLEDVDLNEGTYLIVLMGTDCPHCHEAVPDLNVLSDTPDLPPLIALCTSKEQECIEFVEDFQPVFPIGHISEKLFWRLLSDGDMPRTILLQDGRIKRVWDLTVPDEGAVQAELSFYNPS